MANSGKGIVDGVDTGGDVVEKLLFRLGRIAYPNMVSELHRLIIDPAPCTQGTHNVLKCDNL